MEFKAGYWPASLVNICHAIRRMKISQSRMIDHHLFIFSKENTTWHNIINSGSYNINGINSNNADMKYK